MVQIRLFHGLIGTLAFAALLISGCIVNPVPTSSTGGGGATAGQDGAAMDTFSASDSGVRFGGSDTATDSAASDVSGGGDDAGDASAGDASAGDAGDGDAGDGAELSDDATATADGGDTSSNAD